MDDPSRAGQWKRCGLIVGQVQSGKTANYTGVVCKAADAGYRVIIILAGTQNSLRSQTQLRLDQGFLGFNTERATAYSQNNQRIGVGLIRLMDEPIAHSLTGSAENGDFSRTIANQINVVPGGNDPVIVVVKKNKSILDNLLQWLSLRSQNDPADNRRRILGVPILVIDDEADNASVNTKPIPLDETGAPLADYDVTAINGLIRRLLDTFQRSAYIGYTATPFANIFIDPFDETAQHGEGLFPRSFIISLPTPSNHIGPDKVFGLDRAPEAGVLVEQDGLPVIRQADDGDLWLPAGHKNFHPVTGLPDSLRRAILSFVLTCAARRARGDESRHNSMLIHVTRFTVVQRGVQDVVREELQSLQNRLRYGDGGFKPSIRNQLRELWETDFGPTTKAFIALGAGESHLREQSWNEVEPFLPEAALAITLKVINGSVADVLDYKNNPDGISVIAIGGDKLSRGLTLEGLSVSYFLRSSKMYDTLMQMGRWFGYRPGYADLCRLYTTHDLADWYRHIALASEELRREFEHMAAIGGTPRDYGLRVRTHPNGLKITGASKLRTGTQMKVSFSGTMPETVVFARSPEILTSNFQAVERFLCAIQEDAAGRRDQSRSSRVIWNNVPASDIIGFLQEFRTHQDAPKVNSRLMADFIAKKSGEGKLLQWTVVLLTGGQADFRHPIRPVGEVRFIRRERISADDSRQCVRRIVSPSDELIDLSDAQRESALNATRAAWERKPSDERGKMPDTPAGPDIRDVRPQERGLLLIYPVQFYDNDRPVAPEAPTIGIALSFPSAGAASDDGVVYHVNNIYWQQEFELS